MSFLRGRDGSVLVSDAATTPPATTMLHVQSWNADESGDVVRGWGMGDTHSDAFVSISQWTGSITVYADNTPAGQSAEDLLSVRTVINVRLFPGENVAGNSQYDGLAVVSSKGIEGTKDGIPTLTYSVEGKGALTRSTIT